ncbi:MAG: hypothetical protein HYV14_13525 [Elusimicrobia bacterium]|nr:hypothetical protein [Elusimicrobiota bacterium]
MTKKRLARIGVVILMLGVLCVVGGLVVVGRFSGGPVVTIVNETEARLSEVSLTGDAWRHAVPDLEPGAKVEVSPAFRGETGMSISFSAGGKTHSPKAGIYLESFGGYRAVVVIHKDFSVLMNYGASK